MFTNAYNQSNVKWQMANVKSQKSNVKTQMGKNLLVMDTFATCFVIFRLNPERYKYKLFINKVTHMDLIITQSLCFILFLFINSLYLYLSGLSLKRTKHVAKVSITNEFLPN